LTPILTQESCTHSILDIVTKFAPESYAALWLWWQTLSLFQKSYTLLSLITHTTATHRHPSALVGEPVLQCGCKHGRPGSRLQVCSFLFKSTLSRILPCCLVLGSNRVSCLPASFKCQKFVSKFCVLHICGCNYRPFPFPAPSSQLLWPQLHL
jgi:hypothetical protein